MASKNLVPSPPTRLKMAQSPENTWLSADVTIRLVKFRYIEQEILDRRRHKQAKSNSLLPVMRKKTSHRVSFESQQRNAKSMPFQAISYIGDS